MQLCIPNTSTAGAAPAMTGAGTGAPVPAWGWILAVLVLWHLSRRKP